MFHTPHSDGFQADVFTGRGVTEEWLQAFLEGFLCLSFVSIIVAFHNVWHGPGLVLTLIGWVQGLKGLGRFVAPQLALRVMARASTERNWSFRAGGVIALTLSGFLWWLRFRA